MATALLPHRSRMDLGRLALRVDAAYVAAAGLTMLLGAGPVGRFIGWDPTAIAIGGLIFLPYAGWMYWESTHSVLERRDLTITPLVIAAFGLLSAAVLLVGTPELTLAGQWTLALGNAGAMVIGIMQWKGLRRLRSAR